MSDIGKWEKGYPHNCKNLAYAARVFYDSMQGSKGAAIATQRWVCLYAIPHFFGTEDLYKRQETDGQYRDLIGEGQAIGKALHLLETELRLVKPSDWMPPASGSKGTYEPHKELPDELISIIMNQVAIEYLEPFYSGEEEELA